MYVEIRRPIINDFLMISELDRVAWENNEHSQFIPDGEHAWRLWVEYALIFCAYRKERVVGVILAFPTIDSSSYILHKIFLEYSCRNEGVGKKLFSALCNEIDKLKVSCSLTTSPSNFQMIALCQIFGFSNKELIKSYYRKEEDRFFYTREKI